MDEQCTVTFTGTQGGKYYVACNLVEYLDEKLVNTGSSTIYLYPAIQSSSNQTNITIPALSYPYYTVNNVRNYITNARNVSFNNRAEFYRERNMVEIVLLTIICCFVAIRLLVRRGR